MTGALRRCLWTDVHPECSGRLSGVTPCPAIRYYNPQTRGLDYEGLLEDLQVRGGTCE